MNNVQYKNERCLIYGRNKDQILLPYGGRTGRGSDHSRTELLALAVQAAERIFQTEGLQALTVRRVSKEIGYSIGTIYNLFENPDDLSLHVKARTLDALYAHIREVPRGINPEADMLALNDAYFGFLRQKRQGDGGLSYRQFPARKQPRAPLTAGTILSRAIQGK